jgi:hypothetical protein
LYDARATYADSAWLCAAVFTEDSAMKIFWRLILPVILAAVLAVGLTFEVIGRGSGRFHGFGPPWFRGVGGVYLMGGIFVFFLVASLWKTLHWGKESEEYAELLKEEEADEEKRRREGVS